MLFGAGTQATQLQFIQQPEDYNSGTCTNVSTPANGGSTLTFNGVDFVGGGDSTNSNPITGNWSIQPGDYFIESGTITPHLITGVSASGTSGALALQSPVTMTPGTSYRIVRMPRPIPSEDLITLPAGFVIDKTGSNNGGSVLPMPDLLDGDLVFAPSGGVIGQGTQANKIFLWICSSATPYPATTGSPLIVSVQVRTGAIGSYPVLPGNPFFYANDPRASGI